MSEWNAVIGRFSFFPGQSSTALPSALTLFRKVWGGEPLGFQTPTNPLLPSVAEGRVNGLSTSCSVSPTRFDLTLSGATPESPPTESPKLVLIEDGNLLHDELARIAASVGKDWLPNPILRVAVFIQVSSIGKTLPEANKAIASIIPERYRIKLENEEEFVLQLNRPRTSKAVENLKMNHITKWSVDRLRLLSLATSIGPTPIAIAPLQSEAEIILATITLDDNNDPVPLDKALANRHQSSLLLESLGYVAASMQEGGLDIKGFTNGKLIH